MEDKDERIIRVLGDGKERDREIEHYKDFHCFGRLNVDDVCCNCRLRFRCFTDREYIEIPITDLRKRSLKNVTIKTIVNKFSDVIVKFTVDDSGRGHAKIDFNKVVTKNDV